MGFYGKICETAGYVKDRILTDTTGTYLAGRPLDALVLGSGLGALVEKMTETRTVDYSDIPHWPTSSVEGHEGKLVYGKLNSTPVIVMQGRSHYYEGYSPAEVTFPIRVFAQLGIERLLVTNSSGGVNRAFVPGDLMLITDHLNMTGYNPLVGPNDDRLGPRFPDMTHAYDAGLREKMLAAANRCKVTLKSGVYAGFSGPSYETPAEIKMLAIVGADAVGMSTVPEVIVANHAGLKVAGVSCITNMAAGILNQKLHHDEVKETADRVRHTFMDVVMTYIEEVNR